MKVTLQIPNWGKYNSGNFKHKYKHWFKNKADIIYSPGLLGLSPGQKWFWIYILAQNCAQNTFDTVIININHAARTTDLSVNEIIQAIEILKENETVKILGEFITPKVPLKGEFTPLEKSREEENTEQNRTEEKKRIDKNTEEKQVSTELKKISVSVQTKKVEKSDFKDFFNQKLLSLYPQEYLDREKIKMELWLVSNPLKNPKSQRGWTRFITGWLERGWDNYRRSIATQAPKKKTWQEMVEEEERAKENGENAV